METRKNQLSQDTGDFPESLYILDESPDTSFSGEAQRKTSVIDYHGNVPANLNLPKKSKKVMSTEIFPKRPFE